MDSSLQIPASLLEAATKTLSEEKVKIQTVEWETKSPSNVLEGTGTWKFFLSGNQGIKYLDIPGLFEEASKKAAEEANKYNARVVHLIDKY